MKAIIAIVIFISIIDNNIIEARRVLPGNYMKNIHKSINNICNNKAYNITNNSKVYNCLSNNHISVCRNLTNFTDYINIKTECINIYNSEFGTGIIISIFLWFILSLMSLK
jgi:hypothetical protein